MISRRRATRSVISRRRATTSVISRMMIGAHGGSAIGVDAAPIVAEVFLDDTYIHIQILFFCIFFLFIFNFTFTQT